jgi:Ca-activated chloride channel family protein
VLALAAAAAPATAVELALVRPEAGTPISGAVEVAVEIYPVGAAVDYVEFYLDGVRVAVAERPPFLAVIDAGEENAEHHLEALVWAGGAAAASASVRTPKIHSDLEIDVGLQQLYVTLEQRSGEAGALTREQFTVLDEGVPQQLVTFERGEVPFTSVLLLDASLSMTGERLRTATDGAVAFARGMQRLDEAKLVLFADRVLLETPFASVPAILTLGLHAVEAAGGTALNDAIYLALKRLETRQGRRVAVILSDGVDVDSVAAMADLRRVARRNQATLYWLRLGADPRGTLVRRYSAWRDAAGHELELQELEVTVLESGGRIEPLASLAEVPTALGRLLAELRDQYVLGYYPSTKRGSGAWHSVQVRTEGGDRLRTREGYLEP